MTSTPELAALAKRLYERRQDALVVPYEDRASAGFAPVHHECHRNVDLWVQAHPRDQPVRGWLSFDAFYLLGYHRFQPHSVVADENGRLFDVTPSLASQRYPFLRHEGTDAEYVALVESSHLVHLDHPIAADEAIAALKQWMPW